MPWEDFPQVPDSSFESQGLSGFRERSRVKNRTFTGHPSSNITSGISFEGDYHARLTSETPSPPSDGLTVMDSGPQLVGFVPNASNRIILALKRNGSTDHGLEVYADYGSGLVLVIALLGVTGTGSWVEWSSSAFIPTAHQGTLQVRTTEEGPPYNLDNETRWRVDLVRVQVDREDMVTKDLEDALVVDLTAITIANGYSTDVDLVAQGIEEREKSERRVIYFSPGPGSDSAVDELNQRTAEAFQRWNLKLHVKDPDPHGAIEKLLDDVRNAVAGANSGTLCAAQSSPAGTWKVMAAGVESWGDEIRFSEDVGDRWAEITVSVVVKYVYLRKNL